MRLNGEQRLEWGTACSAACCPHARVDEEPPGETLCPREQHLEG